MPKRELKATYRRNIATSPPCNIRRLSFAKVEKVVNPPQKPAEKKRHQGDNEALNLVNNPKTTPRNVQPSKFTASVPHGNAVPHAAPVSVETKYRNAPPKKLPSPTSNINFIITNKISNPTRLPTARTADYHIQKKDSQLLSFQERKTRLELATPTLARLCSTN